LQTELHAERSRGALIRFLAAHGLSLRVKGAHTALLIGDSIIVSSN
jgi:hypothetical protein